VLYGEPSSSFSLPFFALSVPAFVHFSGASDTLPSSPYADALHGLRVDKGDSRDGNRLAEKNEQSAN
jgi:hypothetical protein